MRVKSVTVSGFGALWGKFEFDEEMTLVGGPNESGKSTLHTALRLALCGVERTPRGHVSKEAEELLRRYRPWDVGRFTVEAEVELEGCRYRFVRDLDKPDGDQVFDLTKGGDVTDKFRRGRGVDLAAGLDLGRAAFLSISTVAQDQILSLSGEALRQDLQRASATSGAEGTARAAIDRLERWRQDRIRGDKTTTKPLDTKMKPKELEEARSQLEQAREARRQLDEDLGQRDHLAAELAQAETSAREAEGGWKAKELLELEQDLQQLEEIGQELERTPSGRPPKDPAALREAATGSKGLLKQWQEAEAKVQELTPPEAELERLAKDSHQGELNFLATALDQEAPPLPDEAEAPRRLELLDRRRIGSVRVLADVLAVVGGVAGLCLIGFGIFYGGRQAILFDVAGLVVLVLTGTGFWGLQRRLRHLLAVGGFTSVSEMLKAAKVGDPERAQAKADRERIRKEQDEARKRLKSLGMAEAAPERLRQLAEGLPKAQSQLQERASWSQTAGRFRQELVARARRVGISGDEPTQLAEQLGQKLRDLDSAEDSARSRSELEGRRQERLAGRQVPVLQRRKEQLQTELAALGELPQPNPESPPSEDLRRTYDEAVARRGELQGQLLPLQGRLQQKLKEVGDVALLEERVAALEGEIARLNQAELVVKLAIGELKRAEGLVQNDLAPRLADGLREWLPQLTQDRYRHAWVDPADLQMHVAPRDSGGQIKVDDLSQGTREQIYVLLRTVLAQALSPKGERLPLFFDDPCVSADDTRCQALLDLLRELAHKTQVVVFSHESRVGGWATTAKVPILAMKEVPVSPATAGAAEDKPGESEPVPVLEEV